MNHNALSSPFSNPSELNKESNEVVNLIRHTTSILSSILTNDSEVSLYLLKSLQIARDKGLQDSGVNEKASYWESSYPIEKQIVLILVSLARDSNNPSEHSQNCFVEIDASKSRLLRNLISSEIILDTPKSVPIYLVKEERILGQKIAQIDLSAYVSQKDSPEPRKSMYKEWINTAEKIKRIDPSTKKYLRIHSGDPLIWEDISELLSKLGKQVVIISLFVTDEQIILCVMREGFERPTIVEVSISQEELQYYFIKNYNLEIFNHNDYLKLGRPLTHRWRELGRLLFIPCLPYLSDATHLVIVPHGPLHLLPLHALTLDDQGSTLLDTFTISYIPALSLLDRLQRRPPITTAEASIIMGYTSHVEERGSFLGEAVQSAKQLGVNPALDEAASGAALRAAVSERALRLLHLSCHGYFHGSDPLRSGIQLADGLFTARDFMNLRFQADLVTLSACQTGMSGSLGGDEMAGLSQALLYAGASSLLMGLWSVNAFTTAALMADLYRRLWGLDGRKQMSEAQALREAALALRRGELTAPNKQLDLTDPYYWASFVLVGDWR